MTSSYDDSRFESVTRILGIADRFCCSSAIRVVANLLDIHCAEVPNLPPTLIGMMGHRCARARPERIGTSENTREFTHHNDLTTYLHLLLVVMYLLVYS